jgi:tetratricopeptide (TPR) repeat protein
MGNCQTNSESLITITRKNTEIKDNTKQDENSLIQAIQELLVKGEFEKANKIIDEALKEYPKSTELMFKKSIIYCEMKDFEKVIELSEEILNISPSLLTAMFNKANALRSLRQNDEAFKLVEYILEQDIKYLNAHILKLTLLERFNKYEEGLEYAEICLQKFGPKQKLLTMKSRFLFKLGRDSVVGRILI